MATVMEKLTERCRVAFQAKQPLIMADTEERELMLALARQCRGIEGAEEKGLVELVRKNQDFDDKNRPYYSFIDADPYELTQYENFHTGFAKLVEFAKNGAVLSGGAMPSLFLLHLTGASWKPASSKENSMITCLRAYVNSYLDCEDNSAPLRNSLVLLYGDISLLPADLLLHTEIVTVDYPEQEELRELIRGMAAENDTPLDIQADWEDLSRALSGFSLMDATRIMRRLLWQDDGKETAVIYDPTERKKTILDAKKQTLLQNGGLLELQENKNKNNNGLGGFGAFQKWAEEAKEAMLHPDMAAEETGTPPWKGALLCGVPGCGKSEAAKILHRTWGFDQNAGQDFDQLPMVKMDIDRLMASHVGESEKHMREALKQAEAMAPCILWIDEVDKGFSGSSSSSGGGDGGTFKRMFGRLLTWMQENEKACFIIATANDISQLPPEFFRNGRYDARFSVFMPTHKECTEIFKEHMRRAEKLRMDARKSSGNAEAHPLFDDSKDGCFSEACLNEIMDFFLREDMAGNGRKDINDPLGVKFVSGADIRLIVNTALRKMTTGDKNAPLTAGRWKALVWDAIHSPFVNTQGGSSVGLERIADCYARLLRDTFVPVSDSDQVLFQKEFYQITTDTNGRKAGSYTGKFTGKWPYDEALFNAISKRIEDSAKRIENE